MKPDFEQWKDIPCYEGLYQASNLGRVKALKKVRTFGRYTKNERVYPEKIMCQRKLPKREYLYLTFCKDGKPRSFTVHRIIATLFCENPFNLPVVNYLDCDPQNNRADNLEWTTLSGNSKHACDNGRFPSLFGMDGIKNPSAKPVIDSATGKIYSTVSEASKALNVSVRSLYYQLSGQEKKKTTLNFIS